ncbi:MAG: hypothetical protein ABI895_38785 [Deltaproteobacteria bacterium]
MVPQTLAAAVGVSILAAPAFLAHGRGEALIVYIAGPLIAAVGLIASWPALRGLRWLNASLGLALLVAEAVLGAKSPGSLYGAFAGMAVVLLSIVPGSKRHAYAGGWRALL